MKQLTQKEIVLNALKRIYMSKYNYCHSSSITVEDKDSLIERITTLLKAKEIPLTDRKEKELKVSKEYRKYAIKIINNSFASLKRQMSKDDLKSLRLRRTDPLIRVLCEIKQSMIDNQKFEAADELELKIQDMIFKKMGE